MAKGRTSRRKRKPSPNPAEPGAVRRWWAALSDEEKRAVGRRALICVVTVAAVVGVGYGLRQLRRYVMAQPSYAENVAGVVLADRPEWMDDVVAAEIRTRLTLAAGRTPSTFDPDLAERVYAEARRCPWIRRVDEVRIRRAPVDADDGAMSGGRIVVAAEYRKPVAQAVGPGGERYIDVEGIVLPTDSARLQAGRWRMIRITGLRAPAPESGVVWPGDDLTAGLDVLRLLADRPYFDQITAIDVSNFRHRYNRAEPSIRLVAVDGQAVTEIRFGDLPDSNLPPVGAPSLDRRLGYLDSWYRRNGRRLAGPTYLDLRLPDRIGVPKAYVP
ncbi:MAG: cell division protein FtsQ/DivIB [Planctomycetota bacterium]